MSVFVMGICSSVAGHFFEGRTQTWNNTLKGKKKNIREKSITLRCYDL